MMRIANYIAILSTHCMYINFGYRFYVTSLVLLDVLDRKLQFDKLKDIVLLHQY